MSTDAKSSEKFMDGDRVRLRGTDRTGVVDGYEYYHGVRVWVREGNLLNLLSAYHEDALELVEAAQVVGSFKALTEAAEEGPDKATSFSISRRMARGLLDYIAELENRIKAIPLQVNDRVREVGDDEPSGTIIEIREVNDEPIYEVKLDLPSKHFTTIMYYHHEIELYERAK